MTRSAIPFSDSARPHPRDPCIWFTRDAVDLWHLGKPVDDRIVKAVIVLPSLSLWQLKFMEAQFIAMRLKLMAGRIGREEFDAFVTGRFNAMLPEGLIYGDKVMLDWQNAAFEWHSDGAASLDIDERKKYMPFRVLWTPVGLRTKYLAGRLGEDDDPSGYDSSRARRLGSIHRVPYQAVLGFVQEHVTAGDHELLFHTAPWIQQGRVVCSGHGKIPLPDRP